VFKTLRQLLENLFGDGIARMLEGVGLSLVTTAVLLPLIVGALNLAASAFSGMGADILAIVALSGIGEALSIVGSAILTRFAMGSASVGLRKKTT
jgi:hypothetical protein